MATQTQTQPKQDRAVERLRQVFADAPAGVGQLRTIETLDGREIVERQAIDNVRRCFRYSNVAGMPVSQYSGTIEVKPYGSGSVVDWRTQFLANHQTDRAVKVLVSTLLNAGLESLKSHFGGAP